MEFTPIFKGATKPQMMLGVPMTALILWIVPWFILAAVLSWIVGLGAYLLMLIPLSAIPYGQYLIKKDDQYFRMLGLEIKERMESKRNRCGKTIIVPPREIGVRDVE